ncbi:MAG: serine/threonine-protein kinase [Zavarzinella sp.]
MGLFDGLAGLFSGGSKGKTVDIEKRFRLSGKTGQGSMSKVFKAYDSDLGREVCLKILDKDKTKKFEERFKIQGLKKPSEGEISLSLKHPNCLTTYEYGKTTKGEPYLVMEWIEGFGLNYLIETKSSQLNGNRVYYLTQLCDALAYLHDKGYLHRDLCPRNIMVNLEGQVKLIDFGLTIPYTAEFCRPGNRTGTAEYLAPEIIKRQSTDHRVDLYALGITAFEILTGTQPWERSVSSEDTMRKRLNSPPREPKSLNPDLEDDICRFLSKSIAKEPADRYRTAAAMKEVLESLGKSDY